MKTTKPVGKSGVTRITRTANGHEAEFQKVAFPQDKKSIETEIAQGFISSARNILPPVAELACKQNEECDFDFSLLLADGTRKYLELKEVAPLNNGPYHTADSSYMVYDFASVIRRLILKQSARYRASTGPGLYLLLYVTDWRFQVSPSVITLLRYWTLRDQHCFRRIYIYQVRERLAGQAEVIYPEAVPANFDPESLRHNRVHNADPANMVQLPGGGIGWKFGK